MPDPGLWAVDGGYHDAHGEWRVPPASTVDAVLSAMGATSDGGQPGRPDPTVDDPENPTLMTVRLDHPLPLVAPGRIVFEDGGEVATDGTLPPDLPTGYHWLVPREGTRRRLVVSPGVCPLPTTRMWGVAAQLYAARSAGSWGMGDLADLGALRSWSDRVGADVTLLNPLHAAPPGPQQQPSPYFASSRCFVNPLYLRVEDVAGSSELADLDALAASGRALNQSRHIDRDRVWALKSAALEAIFAAREANGDANSDADLDAFVARRGAVNGFATFNALAEVHGLPWQEWPSELRRPDGPAVARFAASAEGRRRVRYHAWLQCQLDHQLDALGKPSVIADLAIGVDAGGADSWLWQDTFAAGMRVGAPPDRFNTLGQDWGLPPWDPWRLRAAGYEPFIQTVRAGMGHAAGLRFDHVMGLFRLFWIPEGGAPPDGTYVRYPYWDLLNILALEAERADAFVVGEDLGTVEDYVRVELRERQILSYKLLWFESERPGSWDPQALGAVSTHDLPTVAGVWSGADLAAQRQLELDPSESGAKELYDRLAGWTNSPPDTPVETVIEEAYGLLAEAPCYIRTVSLDDLAAVEERPNMPGTIDEWPNWCIALPTPLEALEQSPTAHRVAARMTDTHRSEPGRSESGRAPGADGCHPAGD